MGALGSGRGAKRSGRRSRVARKRTMGVLFAAWVGLAACGPAQPNPQLPPPTYEEPRLPEWEAPAGTQRDIFDDAALEGEWAEDPTQVGPGGAPGS